MFFYIVINLIIILVAIADLAKDDNGIDKTIMDLYWGMK